MSHSKIIFMNKYYPSGKEFIDVVESLFEIKILSLQNSLNRVMGKLRKK